MSTFGVNRFQEEDTGETYLKARLSYPRALFEYIFDFHQGAVDCAVDIGCGPGIVTKAISPDFTNVLGVDPSDSMIKAARRHCSASNIRYEQGSAERLDAVHGVEANSVDLLIGGTMAHWLDHEPFYKTASKVLRPKGTIALFANTQGFAAPSVPQCADFNTISKEFRDETYQKHKQKGNAFVESLYADLPVPDDFASTKSNFEPCVRKQWDLDQQPDDKQHFFMTAHMTIDQFVALQESLGPVVHWAKLERQAGRDPQARIDRFKKDLHDVTGLAKEDKVEIGTPLGLVLMRRR